MSDVVPEQVTLAVVVAQLEYVRADIATLGTRLDVNATNQVSRGEWIQRNQSVDDRFASYGREIAQLRTSHAASKAPWWAVGSLVVSVVTVAWAMLGG